MIYNVGDSVRCGFCRAQTVIQSSASYGGQFGFDLACGHRNGYCEVCKELVLDTSDTGDIVSPMCSICSHRIEQEQAGI